MSEPFVATHRHYKGGLYQKLFDAVHTETEEPMTVYRTPDGRAWCRPKAMFDGEVGGVPRFAAIPTGESPPSRGSKE
jgi:hypothetical protein